MKPVREMVTCSPDASFRVAEIREPLSFTWHHHPELELLFIWRGAGQRFIADEIAPFDDRALLLIGSDVPHAFAGRLTPSRFSPRATIIQFAPSLIPNRWPPLNELRDVRRLLDRASVGLTFDREVGSALAPVIEKISRSRGLERLLALLHLLDRLAVDCHGTAIDGHWRALGARPSAGPESCVISEIQQYVAEHLAERLPLTAIARRFDISTATLCRLFRCNIGLSFADYVSRVRIGHACRLLVESDLPIYSISYQAGFDNLSNFNRRFRKTKGTTPSAYRRCYREVGQAPCERRARRGD